MLSFLQWIGSFRQGYLKIIIVLVDPVNVAALLAYSSKIRDDS